MIKTKYSAVLQIQDGYVSALDGIQEWFEKEKESLSRSPLSDDKDRPSISMTITISNVDHEMCGNFLWDLANMAIREKFKFSSQGNDANVLRNNNGRGAIIADAFEANHTIVTRTFDYLTKKPEERTKELGKMLIGWLPYHMNKLRQLEDDEKGTLTWHQNFEIGKKLHTLFRDDKVFQRHRDNFSQSNWLSSEMKDMQKWLMDSAIVRRLDKNWRAMVQTTNPTRGYLKELVQVVLKGFLRERSWDVINAYKWVHHFMAAVS